MNFIRMSVRNIIKNIKKYYLTIATYGVSVIIIFNIINLTNNPNLLNLESMEVEAYFSIMLLMLINVIIAFIMCCYVTNYYATTKVKEIGIIQISGGSVGKTAKYLAVQNIILQGLGLVIGGVLALVVSPIFNWFVKINLESNGEIFFLSSEAILLTVIIVIIEFVMSILVSTGFSYRRTVVEVLNYEKTVFESDKRFFKKPTLLYFIVYFSGLIPLYFLAGEDVGPVFWVNMIYCVIGAIGIIRYSVPDYLNKFRKNGKLYSKEKNIITGNVVSLILKTTALISFVMVVISSTIGPLLSTNTLSYEIIFLTNIQLFSILAIMSLAIIFKLLAEFNNRKMIFRNLSYMGYRKKELNNIIKKEIGWYYGIMIILTFIPLIIMGISSVNKGFITLLGTIQVLIAPLLTMIILGFISFYLYRKVIFNNK